MIALLKEIVICAMLLGGSLLMLLAALGIQRFADPLCRAHALSKASTLGICLLLGAHWVAIEDDIAGLKILLIIVFSLLTLPLSSHLIASFAFQNDRTPPPPPSRRNPPPAHK